MFFEKEIEVEKVNKTLVSSEKNTETYEEGSFLDYKTIPYEYRDKLVLTIMEPFKKNYIDVFKKLNKINTPETKTIIQQYIKNINSNLENIKKNLKNIHISEVAVITA